MMPDDLHDDERDPSVRFEETLRGLCLSMDPRQAVVDSLRRVLPTARARLYCLDEQAQSGHWFCAGTDAHLGAAGILTERCRVSLSDFPLLQPSYVRFDEPGKRDDLVAALARMSGNAFAHGAVHMTVRAGPGTLAWLSMDADAEGCLERGLALLQQHAKTVAHCLSSQAAFASSFQSSLGASGLLEAISEPAFLMTREGIPLACNTTAKRSYENWPGWLGPARRPGELPEGVNVIPMRLGEVDMDLVLAKSMARASTAPPGGEVGAGSHAKSWSAELGLTPSLQRVADLMVKGLSDRLIAEELGLTFNSVRTYARRIYALTGVRNRVELTRLALQTAR